MQTNSNLKNYHILQGFSLSRYIGDALVYAFLALYFNSLNLPAIQTGTLLASVPTMAICGNIIMSLISKSTKRNLLLMKLIMPFEMFGMVLIGFFDTFIPVLICSLLMNICNSCFYSLLDGVAGEVSASSNKKYAGIRIFGSIAYFIGSFSGGFLINSINYKFTFIIAATTYLIGYIIIYFINSNELNSEQNNEQNSNFLKVLFSNKTFIFYLVFYTCVMSMNNITDNFFSLFAKDIKGMPEDIYGIVYSSMILVEVIMMFISLKIKKINNKLILIIASLFLIARPLTLFFEIPYFMLFIVPIFRGIGWGLILAYNIVTLNTFLESKYITKAILVLTIFTQISNMILNQFGPIIVEKTSYNIFFIILATIGTIGLISIAINKIKRKTEN